MKIDRKILEALNFGRGLSQIQPPQTIYPQLGANRQSQVRQAVVNHHVLTQLYPLLL